MSVISTPAGIAAYRLFSLRSMLKLEQRGLKTRGGALRPRIAAEFGVRPRDSYETFLAAIDTRIAALSEA